MKIGPLVAISLLVCATNVAPRAFGGETNTNALETSSARAEQIRARCVENRRRICGRVLEITPAGLVVDSGYTSLCSPPFNHDWLTPRTASVPPRTNVIEGTDANTVAVGLVLLTDIPRRPKVRQYDYVSLIGYPAGQYVYEPLPGVQKSIRRFAGGLEKAITLNLQPGAR